mmetsp:Transcript_9433/g.21394  ORF Transcript_9433/g.21394 Transcript_9433/m.21394 type:complete len:222 (-) Transcript_9433:222-887(-)
MPTQGLRPSKRRRRRRRRVERPFVLPAVAAELPPEPRFSGGGAGSVRRARGRRGVQRSGPAPTGPPAPAPGRQRARHRRVSHPQTGDADVEPRRRGARRGAHPGWPLGPLRPAPRPRPRQPEGYRRPRPRLPADAVTSKAAPPLGRLAALRRRRKRGRSWGWAGGVGAIGGARPAQPLRVLPVLRLVGFPLRRGEQPRGSFFARGRTQRRTGGGRRRSPPG